MPQVGGCEPVAGQRVGLAGELLDRPRHVADVAREVGGGDLAVAGVAGERAGDGVASDVLDEADAGVAQGVRGYALAGGPWQALLLAVGGG